MLLSWMNMKLRDEPVNLDDLIKEYNLDKKKFIDRLKLVAYKYNKKTNQFMHTMVSERDN